MFRTTLRNLLSHKLRLAFSGLAVVLGVAFVSGTLVFTGTLGKTFRHLFATVSADVTVTKKIAFGDEFSTESGVAGNALPASTLDRIRDIPGVDVAEGVVQSEGVYVLDRKGKPYGTGGAPGIGVSASLEKRLSPVTFEKGRNPRTAGEVALDDRTADKTGYRVGDRVRVLTPSAPVSAELVGVFRFGEGGSAGASITAFDPATAQRLLLRPGLYSSIEMLADDGVSQKELKQRVAAELGTGRQINELLMMMAALLVLSIVIAVLAS